MYLSASDLIGFTLLLVLNMSVLVLALRRVAVLEREVIKWRRKYFGGSHAG